MRAIAAAFLALLVVSGCIQVDLGASKGADGTSTPTSGRPHATERSTTTSTGSPREAPPNPTTSTPGGPALLPPVPGEPCVPMWTPRTTANATFDGSLLRINVPIDVILVGFEAETSAQLQSILAPVEIPTIFTYPATASGQAQPLMPTVHYEVHGTSASVAARFRAELQAAPDDATLLDGNAAEAVAAGLLRCAGAPLDPDLPSLVIVHLGNDMVDNHLWAYRGEGRPEAGSQPAWIPGVRAFGGREPFVVFDASASKDPSPDRGYAGRAFEAPMHLDDPGLVPSLAEAVDAATQLRLIHAVQRQVSTQPCVSVAIVYSVPATSADGMLPPGPDPRQQLHPERIAAGLAQANGRPVHVALRVLGPAETDPGLDAMYRMVGASFYADDPLTYATLYGGAELVEPLRPATSQVIHQTINPIDRAATVLATWVDAVWEQYAVPVEGCDSIVAFIRWADGAEYVFNYGFAPVTPNGHSFAFASAGIYERVSEEGSVPVLFGRPAWDGSYDVVDPLLVHELGHDLGLNHAQDVQNGWNAPDWSFSTDIDAMSYRWAHQTAYLGHFDRASIARSRVAQLLVQEHGHGGSNEREQAALSDLASWDWAAAASRLQP